MNLNKLNIIRTTKMSFEFAMKRYVKTKKINLFEEIVNKKKVLLFLMKKISLFDKKRKILNRYIFCTFVA